RGRADWTAGAGGGDPSARIGRACRRKSGYPPCGARSPRPRSPPVIRAVAALAGFAQTLPPRFAAVEVDADQTPVGDCLTDRTWVRGQHAVRGSSDFARPLS